MILKCSVAFHAFLEKNSECTFQIKSKFFLFLILQAFRWIIPPGAQKIILSSP